MSSQLDEGYYVVPTVMFLSSLHPNGNDVMAVLFAITKILLLSVSPPVIPVSHVVTFVNRFPSLSSLLHSHENFYHWGRCGGVEQVGRWRRWSEGGTWLAERQEPLWRDWLWAFLSCEQSSLLTVKSISEQQSGTWCVRDAEHTLLFVLVSLIGSADRRPCAEVDKLLLELSVKDLK